MGVAERTVEQGRERGGAVVGKPMRLALVLHSIPWPSQGVELSLPSRWSLGCTRRSPLPKFTLGLPGSRLTAVTLSDVGGRTLK